MSVILKYTHDLGIVIQSGEDSWRLSCELLQRRLTSNHVTLFWKAFADTLDPLPRKQEVSKSARVCGRRERVARRPTRTRPERTARSVPRAPHRANRPPQTGPHRADVQLGLISAEQDRVMSLRE
ncbi:unnamed protein product [Spodoptera exigua]|nr:unnamed protein product [Spodoptera exigua]